MATIGELIKDADLNVDIGIIVDESGSMDSMKDTVIKCFNDFLKEQKQEGDDAFITLTKFSSHVNIIRDRECMSKAKHIDSTSYNPHGCTALYDGIYDTVKQIESKNKNNKVIIAIITDGYENASKKCTLETIKEIIQEKEKLGWKFLFLASNIDVKTTAGSFGMNTNNARAFAATVDGYVGMNTMLTSDVSNYRCAVRSGNI
jgi:Mg-chelatase subunit ChlD